MTVSIFLIIGREHRLGQAGGERGQAEQDQDLRLPGAGVQRRVLLPLQGGAGGARQKG